MLEDLLNAVVERAVEASEAVLAAAASDEGPSMEALERISTVGWAVVDRHRAVAQAAAEQPAPEALRRTHVTTNHLIARGRDEAAFRTDFPAEWLVPTMHVLFHVAGDDVRSGRLDKDVTLPVVRTTLRDLLAGPGGAASRE